MELLKSAICFANAANSAIFAEKRRHGGRVRRRCPDGGIASIMPRRRTPYTHKPKTLHNMKRRIILSLIFTLSLPAAVIADTYTSLWKQAENARQKDQPRTQLSVLKAIAAKAAKEKAYGHLLKAQIQQMGVEMSIAPDSLEPSVRRIEALERDAAASDMVLADVYRSVLGYVYANLNNDTDSAEEKSRDYYKRSLEQPDALAKAFSYTYEPLVEDGTDSRVFGDDMLHVLGFAAEEYKTLHDYYLAKGNRAAACISAVRLLRSNNDKGTLKMQKSKYLHSIDSLLHVYSDLAEAGELAIERYDFMESSEDATAEQKVNFIDYALAQWGTWPRMNVLRNARRRLTLPNFHVSLGDEVSAPDTPRRVVVMGVCNISELTMTIRKVNITDHEDYELNDDKTYAKVKKLIVPGIVQTQTRRYIGQPEYAVSSDTMEINGLPAGVYLVEFTTDNVSVPVERALLRVSDLFVVSEVLPEKKIRWAVVSATTGLPVPGASICVTTRGINGQADEEQTLTCDELGEAMSTYGKRTPTRYYAYTNDDFSTPEMNFGGHYSYYKDERDLDYVRLYTDRSVYRPGQTVHVAAVAYNYKGKTNATATLPNKELTLTLRDANYKEVRSQKVVTDEYGTASADFQLPSDGLTGRFSVRCSYGRNGTTSFFVEEYKRPTFNVEFDDVATKYQSGDTVKVTGHAKSFAGVAVQGARVAYTVVRRPSLLWHYYTRRESSTTVMRDTVMTENDGSFSLRVPVELPETMDERPRRYYSFDISADVTDVAGETRHGDFSIPLSDQPTMFDCAMPERMECDSTKTIVFEYKNNAGKEIDCDVTYYIDGERHTCKANAKVPLSFQGKPSKKYEITAVCGSDTLRREVVAFSLSDKKAAVETHDWFYQSATEFPAEGKAYIQLGSSDSILHVIYTILSGKEIIESGTLDLRDELMTREFEYDESYGDGLTLTYAWVKGGKLYSHTAKITRPQEDKRLLMKWTTFRDRLTPGQKEEWTLSITRPDGTAAKAQLMSVLYDKSLDEIRQHSWKFSLPTSLNLPSTSWRSHSENVISLYGEMPYKPFDTRSLAFSHIDYDGLQLYRAIEEACFAMSDALEAKQTTAQEPVLMARASSKMATSAYKAEDTSNLNANDAVVTGLGNAAASNATEGGAAEQQQPQLRENLNETAFFYPAIETDGNGSVRLKFTLPESITTWRFIGLAHDRNMNNGLLEGEAVAKKTVMVQPNVPRFVRSADRGSIAARIFNTSEGAVSGTARCELIDPETGKTLHKIEKKYSINRDETAAVAFEYDMSKVENTGLLICRVTAAGKGYSDGEQHYLPVLPDKELVTNTLPFYMDAPGTKTIDLKSLFAVQDKSSKLTVEYTDNPVWLMIQAMPSLATPQNDNAIDLATAYYVNSLGQNIMQQSPVIKQTVQLWQQEDASGTSLRSSLEKDEELKSLVISETPWLLEADRETEQKQQLAGFFDESAVQYRLADALNKLKKLQNADGSFSWWDDMDGNRYITITVAETLVRLNSMTGNDEATQSLLTKAFSFLAKEIADEVKELKKNEKNGVKLLCPSDFATTYLYICSLDGRTLSASSKADNDYLISLLEKQNSALSIFDKARAAVIMSKNGHAAKASELLQSVKEYTVYKEEMGRYYDTPKAQYSWCDYRIPTQTAAIEALKAITPDDTGTITEMQRWLLHSKRTQQWSTPINSVNAIYAFMYGNTASLASPKAAEAVVRLNGEKIDMPKPTAGLGYAKAAVTGGKMNTLTVEKQSDGTSWGAVYAQFMQQTTDVEAASSGLTVRRDLLKDGKPLGGDGTVSLKTGDKLTVRITLTADRDYDFVQVSDKRAACLEPASQLSGYRSGYYCAPKDNLTNYFFDTLRKGKRVIETTYYVDREGVYHTGTITAQCSYSPEFSARTAATVLTVSK